MMIGKNLAVALATAAFGLVLLCQPGTATADDVTVKKNGTPLMLSPMMQAPPLFPPGGSIAVASPLPS